MLHGWQHLTLQDRQAILHGVTSGEVRGGPYHIELDWVDRCNARCFFCNSRASHDGQSLAFERTIELLGQAAELRSIRMSGGGDPLLHPRTVDLLGWLAGRAIILDNLNTNGIALGEPAISALTRVTTDEVRFSLNYADAESYSRAMGVAPRTFGRVCEAIAGLNAARQGNPRFGKIIIQFFVHRSTAGNIREMAELGRRLGADTIELRELDADDPAERIGSAEMPGLLNQLEAVLREDWTGGRILVQIRTAYEEILKIYYRLAREFGSLSPTMPQGVNYANRYCFMPWYSLTLTGNQAVWPCCFYLSAGIRVLGQGEGKSLDAIWHGPMYARMRREMRDYMLLQERPPLFSRRMRTVLPRCASHTECPLTMALCDETFYAEADSALAPLRRRLSTRLWRFPNHLGRIVIDQFRARPGAK